MEFEKDTAEHKMTVENDNGVHRSLHFGKPGTMVYYFRINTWPGHLCISGDMGTYVFSRLEDMFEFFRGEGINPQYWSEKIQAESIFGRGVMEYKPDTLKATLKDWLKGRDDADKILEEVEPYLDDHYSADEAIRAIYNCKDMGDFITDIGPNCYKDYTSHYLWCCKAIVWAIGVYDAEKLPVEQVA